MNKVDKIPTISLKPQEWEAYTNMAFASETKLKHDNNKVVAVVFKPNTLKAGTCYDLSMTPKYDWSLCTSACSCSQQGTSKCDE
jgi:hypothetical protein